MLRFRGAGWIATPYQIKYISPEASVAYRFIFSGLITLFYARFFIKNKNIKKRKDLSLCFCQGILLFGFNYILVYFSAHYTVSGLIAVTVSLLILPAMGWRWLLFKRPPQLKNLLGALIGIGGVYFLFAQDIQTNNKNALLGFTFAFGSTFLSSLGMNISEKMKDKEIDVVWGAGYSMLFGGLMVFAYSFFKNSYIDFSYNFEYLISLAYLIIITFIMMPLYLVLTSRIGAGKASYVWVITPLISLSISNLFEGYIFTLERFAGAILIIIGGILMKIKLNKYILKTKKKTSAFFKND